MPNIVIFTSLSTGNWRITQIAHITLISCYQYVQKESKSAIIQIICSRLKLDFAALASVRSWARDRVSVVLLVEVEDNGWVVLVVQASADNASRLCGAGASNLQVDALWVVLRTTDLASRVESDDLVAENVVAWSDG